MLLQRVESISVSLNMNADFTGLRKSISRLQARSAALDAEKVEAERKFRELLDKLPGRRAHGAEHEHKQCAHGHLPGWLKRVLRKIFRHGLPEPIRRFIEAAQRVQRANAKLVAFERGFISEEGIKDREWYKHLAVAPGKWLGACPLPFASPEHGGKLTFGGLTGYGATTLPSITEALTFEKNVTLAELEAARVSALLDKLSETIKV